MNFQQLNNVNNNGKIYLAIIDSKHTSNRKVFVRYDCNNNFTYFSLINSNIPVIYPIDFHDENETIAFYEINLPEEIVKNIQNFGTQY